MVRRCNSRNCHGLRQRQRVAGRGGGAEELDFFGREAVKAEDEVLDLEFELSDLRENWPKLSELASVLTEKVLLHRRRQLGCTGTLHLSD
jgi:hypothetical protein